jgi:hypothetical protein
MSEASAEKKPAKIKAMLGVGCFHFAPATMPKGTAFDLGEFAKRLKKALESESNINNVNLTGFAARTFRQPSDVPNIMDGPDFFPHLSDVRISFDLYIPFRLQKELYDGQLKTETESFRVSINYHWRFPVALIEPVSTKPTSSPSDCVVCTRKFLERRFGKGKNSDVEFQALGPSPFHADFIFDIVEDETAFFGHEIECSVVPSQGYDRIWVEVKTSDPLKAAKGAAFMRFADELEFYYEVIQAQGMNLKTWVMIERAIDKLQERASKPAMRKIASAFGMQGLIDRALFLTTELERRSISVRYDARKWKAELERVESKCFLWEYINNEVEEVSKYPVEQILRLISIFEERRKLALQNVAVVVSAIAGGVIGAGVAALISLLKAG